MEYIVEVKGLKTALVDKKGSLTLLDGVDFEVRAGETLGIVGESGCGKSVTALSIMRLLGKRLQTEGTVILNGRDLLKVSDKEMRKVRGNEAAMIFQEPMTSLNPVMTIGSQIAEVLKLHANLPSAAIKPRVIELIQQVGIARAEELYDEYPHRFSGGMRQRITIAMAIACNPKLLIADEPTTALDVTIQAQILDLIRSLKMKYGMSVILITHDLGVVAEMCDRVLVMYAGQTVEAADVRTLLRNPKHPYTQGLIRSSPRQSKGAKRLVTIAGNVPFPGEWPQGCRFEPRCSHAMPSCREGVPPFLEMADGSRCRCLLYEGKEGGTA